MYFEPNPLKLTDGYKIGHPFMLAPGTTRLYGTWIPRSIKHAPKGVKKIVSFGQEFGWKWLHEMFEKNFFNAVTFKYTRGVDENGRPYCLPTGEVLTRGIEPALEFAKDMSGYLGLPYKPELFIKLWNLGYLPIKVKSLLEGVETDPNIPHQTFINTHPDFAWLTLYLETCVSSLCWKASVAATIARLYRKQAVEAVLETDPDKLWLVDFMCHDFSARGLSPFDMMAVGMGHATSFKGSDTLIAIDAVRHYYNHDKDYMPIFSVNASEHSVSTTKIFTVGEQQMISDWMKIFPTGILSIVSDTFDLWKLITEYLPVLKEEILARDGKIVIRPDSGDPVDIICGTHNYEDTTLYTKPEEKGVIQLLWDIFGGTVNKQGYKVLDPHIGAIYGDSITPERQKAIYERLKAKGFAATNIVLGVGSYTYQMNTRDTLGFAAKGAWFEVEEAIVKAPTMDGCEKGTTKKTGYSIYKDPVTDDGTKKSLKGLQAVFKNTVNGDYEVYSDVDEKTEASGELQLLYENGKFYNETTFEEIRERLLNTKFS